MADWHFELAHTWEDLVAAHEKWLRDYNYQKHLAHEKREDGRHSPAEVLGWVSGRQFGLEYLHRPFSASYETRQLNKAGYARFRNFLLYAERGLAGKRAFITLFQDSLTLEYGEYALARCSIEWQADDHHLLSVGNPHLFEHPYHSRQLSLWSPSEVEWLVILPCQTSPHKRKRKQSQIIQLPLPFETNQTHQA